MNASHIVGNWLNTLLGVESFEGHCSFLYDERISELAANNRLAYGEDAEAFKKEQFDQKIDYNDDMFTGGATRFTRGFSERRRTQAIREAENQVDELEKNGKPAFRLREMIALAKEKRAREYIAAMEKDIRHQTEVATRALNPQNRAKAKALLVKRREQLHMVDGKLKAILAEKQRLFDQKTGVLRQLNYANLGYRFLTPHHVLQFMQREKAELFKAVHAAQNDAQAKAMHASLKPGLLRRAWRAIKTAFVDHANDVKEVSKVSAKALTIHQEAADLGEQTADRLEGPITHFDLAEKFFGVVKSSMGFYKKMRAVLTEPALIRDREQPDQDSVDSYRQAPFRMLAARKEQANEYVSMWQRLDIAKEGIGIARYGTDTLMKSIAEASQAGNDKATGMTKTLLAGTQKQFSQLAGAGLSGYGAVQGTVEVINAKKKEQ